MIRFTPDEVARLLVGVRRYKDQTGSEYMWDLYENLEQKLLAYNEEVTPASND